MITFRTGTHNPLTLYVASEPYNQVTGGRELPGWMKDGEWSIGWLPHEGLAALAVEAWNAFVCPACPWGCGSCSLNRATCECYEHQDRIDEDGRPVEGSTPIASPARVGICGAVAPLLMNGVWTKHCTLPHGHDGWHQDDGEPPMMWSVDGGSFAQQSTMPPAAAPAGEVVSVPPPARPLAPGGIITNPPLLLVDEDGCALTIPARADEPAPVPPPVDALLNLVDDLHSAVRDDDSTGIDRARGNIVMAVRALYAAGVEKGRRQATEERTEEQLAAAVTVKGCLGVDRGHGKSDVHYWRCPTPECAGHLCRKDGLAEGAILDGRRTIEPDETVSHD